LRQLLPQFAGQFFGQRRQQLGTASGLGRRLVESHEGKGVQRMPAVTLGLLQLRRPDCQQPWIERPAGGQCGQLRLRFLRQQFVGRRGLFLGRVDFRRR
jgi:hypothetical protein